MRRVLVCDDEPHIVEGLRHLLRGARLLLPTLVLRHQRRLSLGGRE